MRGITLHAARHGLTSQDVYDVVHGVNERPTCDCKPGCIAVTRWHGWVKGYALYVKGHYDVIVRSTNTVDQLKNDHWSRGKTKETDVRLARAGEKASLTLKVGYASGRIDHWATGQTRLSNPVIARHAERMKGRKHRLYPTFHVMALVKARLCDRFMVLTPVADIEHRDNNRETPLTIRCVSCDTVTETSVYNVIRKDRQRCHTCDPPVQWTSGGETALAEELSVIFGRVDRFVWVNGWSIDAYVRSIDTYVQYDGIYWHGLDRPIEENTNVKIVRKYFRDREQVAWFSEHGLKLVRITELEWDEAVDKRALIELKFNTGDRDDG